MLDADDQATAATWIGKVRDHTVTIEGLRGAGENEGADELRAKINALAKSHDFVALDIEGIASLPTSAAIIKSDIAFVPLEASATEIWPIEKALSVISALEGGPEW